VQGGSKTYSLPADWRSRRRSSLTMGNCRPMELLFEVNKTIGAVLSALPWLISQVDP